MFYCLYLKTATILGSTLDQILKYFLLLKFKNYQYMFFLFRFRNFQNMFYCLELETINKCFIA